jgi:steroid 5-alpha reductase family enzyme
MYQSLFAYLIALIVALLTGWSLPAETHPLLVAGAADLAGTLAIFGFSRLHDNSSLYDPYWSVAPMALAVYFGWLGWGGEAPPVRLLVVGGLVWLWGARLTFNFYRRWEGIDDEDWRYADFRSDYPKLYWPLSLAGFHLFPTVLVFGGCLTLYPAMTTGAAPLGWLDGAALLVTLGAIAIETVADEQLRDFLDADHPTGTIMDDGLWAWSRHPNYFGEVGFWWGLWLFALAADPSWWWTGIGALAINLLFIFVSLPLIEDRHAERRDDYTVHTERVSRLFLWPPRD